MGEHEGILEETQQALTAAETEGDVGSSEEIPLYTAETIYTFEEYERFAKTIHKNFGFSWLRKLVVMGGLLCIAFFSWRGGEVRYTVFYLVAAIVFPFLYEMLAKRKIKKAYEDNKRLQGLHETIAFFEDSLEAKSELGNTRLSYEKLYRVLETNTNFYLMVAGTQGVIVTKEACTDELTAFLQELKTKVKNKKTGI